MRSPSCQDSCFCCDPRSTCRWVQKSWRAPGQVQLGDPWTLAWPLRSRSFAFPDSTADRKYVMKKRDQELIIISNWWIQRQHDTHRSTSRHLNQRWRGTAHGRNWRRDPKLVWVLAADFGTDTVLFVSNEMEAKHNSDFKVACSSGNSILVLLIAIFASIILHSLPLLHHCTW
jgi:hypothetical protein